jgi:hypothetical protein
MARETKAQRLEREEAERNAYYENLRNSYFTRLMEVLEKATAVGFVLTVKEGMFNVETQEGHYQDRSYFSLSTESTTDNEDALESLSWRAERVLAEQKEAERKYRLRQTALSKLSKEEREELGL